jgi:hypothetical protein
MPPRVVHFAAAVLFAAAGMAAPDRTFTVTPDGAYPALAKDPKGGFAVAWIGTTANQIFARRFGPRNEPLTARIAVGTYPYEALTVSVAALGGERYRVAWDRFPHRGTGDAAARVLRPRARAHGRLAELGPYWAPSTAALGDTGDWVAAVVGPFTTSSGTVSGVWAQIRAASGGLRKTIAVGAGTEPLVAADQAGNFWVLWTADDGIRVRRFSPGGEVSASLRLTPEAARFAAIAANADGRAVVAWAGLDGIAARLLRPAGGAVSKVVRVDDISSDRLTGLSVAIDARGKTLFVWGACCGEPERILGRRFERSGLAAGDTFVLRDQPALFPAAAAAGKDDFTVVWLEGDAVRGRSVGWPGTGAGAWQP